MKKRTEKEGEREKRETVTYQAQNVAQHSQ
jgi:hypothetical protein